MAPSFRALLLSVLLTACGASNRHAGLYEADADSLLKAVLGQMGANLPAGADAEAIKPIVNKMLGKAHLAIDLRADGTCAMSGSFMQKDASAQGTWTATGDDVEMRTKLADGTEQTRRGKIAGAELTVTMEGGGKSFDLVFRKK